MKTVVKNKPAAFLFLLFCFFICYANFVSAAITSEIFGTVTDKATGEPLSGANVLFVGTAYGSATDLNGEYQILRVLPGNYTLRITFMGYKAKEVNIQVDPGETVKQNVGLEFTVIEAGESVLITAQREGQAAAINRQLTADALLNAVSAERIQEVPDANAAESISRLPGISIERNAGEGQGVVIRGLHPKYSKIAINGVAISSTDDLDRSTDLSMISPENLGGIEVYKAITPDMDADAIGGIVNLQVAKAQEKPERNIRFYGAYNAQEQDLKQYKGFAKWSQRLLHNKLGLQASINVERRNRGSDELTAEYTQGAPRTDGTIPIRITEANITDRLDTRKRWGGSIIFDYDIGDGDLMLSNFYARTDRTIYDRSHGYDDTWGDTRPSISESEINTSIFTNAVHGNYGIYGVKMDWTFSHSYSKQELPFSHNLLFREAGTIPPNIDYEKIDPTDFLQLLGTDSSADLFSAGYQTKSTEERQYGGELNVKIPFQLSNKIVGFIKSGGKFRRITRMNNKLEGYFFPYLYPDKYNFPISSYYDDSYDPGKILNGLTDLGVILDPTVNREFFNSLKDAGDYAIHYHWGANNNYDVTENISAGYLMTQLKFGQLLTFIPGVRYESVNNEYLGYFRFDEGNWPFLSGPYEDSTSVQIYDDWLPMVNLKIKPTPWFDLRLAAVKTLSRPNFWDLVPHFNARQEGTTIWSGNPDLKPARAWNFETYASFYNTALGLFTVGWFYKEIDDITVELQRYIGSPEIAAELNLPIDRYYKFDEFHEYGNRNLLIPVNVPASTIKGVEVDLQTNLSFLPGIFKGFVINANYSRIFSETSLPFFKSEYKGLDPVTWLPVYERTSGFREGTVPGQADHLANVSVGYDIGLFSARVSMFYQGQSRDVVGTQEENDSFNEAFTRWDISVRQGVNNHVSLFLNFVNVSNTREGAFRFQSDRPTMYQYYGRMIDLGVQYSF